MSNSLATTYQQGQIDTFLELESTFERSVKRHKGEDNFLLDVFNDLTHYLHRRRIQLQEETKSLPDIISFIYS